MNRQTLAILVASTLGMAVGSATAQSASSVRIYGLIDMGAAYVKAGNKTLHRLDPSYGSSSRFGFIGSEDLGNGWSAVFNLETTLSPDLGNAGSAAALSGTSTPTAAFFSRNAYVGLKGPLGTLALGRNYTASIVDTYNANVIASGVTTGFATVQASQGIANDYWHNNQTTARSGTVSPSSSRTHWARWRTTAAPLPAMAWGLPGTTQRAWC